MGSNKILTHSGWVDSALVDKVRELLTALDMENGLPWVTVDTDGFEPHPSGPITDENVVRILLELAGMVQEVGE